MDAHTAIENLLTTQTIRLDVAEQIVKSLRNSIDQHGRPLDLKIDSKTGIISGPTYMPGRSFVQVGENLIICLEATVMDRCRKDLRDETLAAERLASMRTLYSLHLRAFMTAANGGQVHPSGEVDSLEKQWSVASGMSAGIGSRSTGAQPLGFEEFCNVHRAAMAGAEHKVHVIRAPQVVGE